MRVGVLSQWFDPAPGPASLPGALARRGHEVQVLTGSSARTHVRKGAFSPAWASWLKAHGGNGRRRGTDVRLDSKLTPVVGGARDRGRGTLWPTGPRTSKAHRKRPKPLPRAVQQREALVHREDLEEQLRTRRSREGAT